MWIRSPRAVKGEHSTSAYSGMRSSSARCRLGVCHDLPSVAGTDCTLKVLASPPKGASLTPGLDAALTVEAFFHVAMPSERHGVRTFCFEIRARERCSAPIGRERKVCQSEKVMFGPDQRLPHYAREVTPGHGDAVIGTLSATTPRTDARRPGCSARYAWGPGAQDSPALYVNPCPCRPDSSRRSDAAYAAQRGRASPSPRQVGRCN